MAWRFFHGGGYFHRLGSFGVSHGATVGVLEIFQGNSGWLMLVVFWMVSKVQISFHLHNLFDFLSVSFVL